MFKPLLLNVARFSTALLALAQTAPAILAQTENPATEIKDLAKTDLSFPGDMACVPRPVYGRRADGQPGREVTLNFKSGKLYQ